jgi:hypothetical protein
MFGPVIMRFAKLDRYDPWQIVFSHFGPSLLKQAELIIDRDALSPD